MCSAKTLILALAVDGDHGRWVSTGMALQGDMEKYCRRLWPGRGGGTTTQDKCVLSASNTSLRFFGRDGSVVSCSGGGLKLYLQHRDKRTLWIWLDVPYSIQPIDSEDRQKAEKILHSSGTAFLIHFVFFSVHWCDGLGSSMLYDSCGADSEPIWAKRQAVGLFFSCCFLHVRNTIAACPRSGCIRSIRPPSIHPLVDKRYESQTVFGFGVEDEKFQIFIKTLSGKTILVWVSVKDTGDTLKTLIAQREGYSRKSVYILYGGKILNEGERLKDCQISKNSTLHVMYRLRGGSIGNRGTTGPSSYKDAARPKGPQSPTALHSSLPKPYIVKKLDDIPSLEVNNTEFESKEEYEKINEQGPWFWGRARLFTTPWFPEFDANTMVVTKMPVWVRLPNLPLPFWHHLVLEDIGNVLGKYIKRDTDRHERGLFTYARICVEIDLSKGLPDRIKLIYEKHKWIQALDYENTAFRCRFCHLTRHLQDSCPLAKRQLKKNQGMKKKGKTWQEEYAPSTKEDSEGEESEPEEKQEEEDNEEKVHKDETVDKHHPESKNTGKETFMENMELMATSLTGSKRAHESENSDSDKEKTYVQPSVEQASKELIVVEPQQGGWTEVKTKKREKKGKLEDYYKNPNP